MGINGAGEKRNIYDISGMAKINIMAWTDDKASWRGISSESIVSGGIEMLFFCWCVINGMRRRRSISYRQRRYRILYCCPNSYIADAVPIVGDLSSNNGA